MNSPHPPSRDPFPTAPPAPPAKKKHRWPWILLVAALVACPFFGAMAMLVSLVDGPTTTSTVPAVATVSSSPALAAADTTAPPAAPTTPAPAETAGQKNARAKAATYLQVSPFSRSGLVKQLAFEGFSQADADYAVDALHADWNEQAVAKAKNYLKVTAFSRAGLIKQLTFEGFTPAEAEHGAAATGL